MNCTDFDLFFTEYYLALIPVADQYRSLGKEQLGLKEHQLEEIEVKHPLGSDGAVQQQLNAVVNVWYRGNPAASWTDIISALRVIGEMRLACEIEREHCRGKINIYGCV